ncbi:MAG TPA: hypothetical protein VKG85_08560 [Actinomycetes bacterium]|nr:hypothetical protein [Actinomycetes bacterium]
MLTSVLPGLRELRAPLSAGFLWLLALWFAAERVVPERATASGPVASAYRLGGLLETIGLGAAVAFAAYLVGSLSVFLFSTPLRRIMRTSAEAPRNWRDTLSIGAWRALQQVAQDAAERLNAVLSLSGTDISEAIIRFRWVPREPDPSQAAPSKLVATRPRPGPWWRRVLAKYRKPRRYPHSPGAWDLPADRDQRQLAELVVPDLPVIATTRLLGKHPDMFSAVDRDRAEVDFRLAVIPPVLALAIAVAGYELGWIGLLVVVVGCAVVVGLMLDAIHQQRLAYNLLLDLLQVNEITAPSLERLESWAADRADRSPAKTLTRHVSDMSLAIRMFLDYVVVGRLSAPINVLTDGTARVAQARQELAAIKTLSWQALPSDAIELAEQLLDRLDRVNRQWRRINIGAVGEDAADLWPEPVEVADLAGELEAAKGEFTRLTGYLQDALLDAANRAAAATAAAGEDPARPPADRAAAGASS